MRTRLSRRSFARGVLAGLGTLALAACAADQPASSIARDAATTVDPLVPHAPATPTPYVPTIPATRATPSAVGATLTVLLRGAPGQLDYFASLGRGFRSQNPHVDVRVIVVNDDFAQTRRARLAAGTAGDVALNATQHDFALEARMGLLRPIDAYANRDKYDLKQHLEGAVRAATLDGQLYALPWSAQPGWSALYYQPALFSAAGLENPNAAWTHDDLVAAAQRLTFVDGGAVQQYGLWVAPFADALQTPIRAHGGDLLDETGTAARLDDPATAAGIQWVADVYSRWQVSPPRPSYDSRISWWTTQRLAMMLSGYWETAELTSATPSGVEWAVVPAPLGPGGRGAALGVNTFPIWASSQNPDAAWEWQKYLASKQVGLANYNVDLALGARSDVWDDPRVQNDRLVAPYGELIRDAVPVRVPANGRTWELSAAIEGALERVWGGELGPEEAIPAAQAAATRVLALPTPRDA